MKKYSTKKLGLLVVYEIDGAGGSPGNRPIQLSDNSLHPTG